MLIFQKKKKKKTDVSKSHVLTYSVWTVLLLYDKNITYFKSLIG